VQERVERVDSLHSTRLPASPDEQLACTRREKGRACHRGHRVNVCEGRQTHLSRIASCQRCNFATSFTWKPKIRGRYRSARNATVAVLIASPRPSAPSTSSSRTRAPRRRGSSTVVAPAPGAIPTAPRAGSAGPLLGGRRAG
jgi:hypothetical protein